MRHLIFWVAVALALAASAALAQSLSTGEALSSPPATPAGGDAWTRWGGPNQDFQAPAHGLAEKWPEDGPQILWRHPLGDGYSAILFEHGRLYTMARPLDGSTSAPLRSEGESVLCLDAATGKTIWLHSYEPLPYRGQRGYGIGPRATPLIVGDLLFTIGATGKMNALKAKDGALLWSRDLWGKDFEGNRLSHGYASSPVAHEDTVIALVGAENASLVAFDQKTGDVQWRALSFKNSYSSPRIARVAGEPQLLAFMAEELIGVDPDTGELRWRYPHDNQWHTNISMPLVVDENTIFLSSPQAGARGLRLTRDGEAIRVEDIWTTRRIQLYHASAVQIGDWVYGSTGVTAVAFMAAINARTGQIGWRERGFAKANTVLADGKLVILDEDGVLYLATATPDQLIVHSKTRLLNHVAWTAPTIVGQTLYARDRTQILAVNLG